MIVMLIVIPTGCVWVGVCLSESVCVVGGNCDWVWDRVYVSIQIKLSF